MTDSKLKENWVSLHDTLRNDLEKEVLLTRELLSNLHQEEISLMLHDAGSLNLVLQQRSHLLEKLSSLRLRRLETTEKIEKIASIDHKHPTIDEILPPQEGISTEILSLSDQLMALNQKMQRQSTQNQRLSEHPEHFTRPPLEPSPESRPKRKASVATYQIKK